METLKDELQKLIWQYGWKVFEEVLPEVRKEVEAKTKKLVEDLKLDLEDHGRLIESSTENKIISMEVPVELGEVLPEHLEPSNIQVKEEVKEDKVLKELQRNKKLYQRERERETRRRNEEAGLTVCELLSEGNLRSWKASGYSKAYIARELVGCREEVVSRAYKRCETL